MTRHSQSRNPRLNPAILTACAALAISLLLPTSRLRAQASTSIPEEIEWTWEVRPQHINRGLPNILLLGDSITRSYSPQVTKDLAGVANVYLLSSSTSVGDPRLPRQIAEFAALENVSFAVVHFNNGMHGWKYTEAQYKASFPFFLSAVRDLPGHGRLIWATTTPVRSDISDGASNPPYRCQKRRRRNLPSTPKPPHRRPPCPHEQAPRSLPGHRSLQRRRCRPHGRSGRRSH